MKMAKSNKLSHRMEQSKNSKGVLASEKNQINSDRKNYFICLIPMRINKSRDDRRIKISTNNAPPLKSDSEIVQIGFPEIRLRFNFSRIGFDRSRTRTENPRIRSQKIPESKSKIPEFKSIKTQNPKPKNSKPKNPKPPQPKIPKP